MNKTQWKYYVIDFLYSMFILFPITVTAWAGTWCLFNLYLMYTENEILNYIISLIIGYLSTSLFYLIIPAINNLALFNNNRIMFVIFSRIAIYINSLVYILFWHGIWNLLEIYLPLDLGINLLLFICSEVILITLKCTSISIGSPFCLPLDNIENYFDFTPRFKSSINQPFYHIFDIFFTTFITVFCIFLWATLWNIPDILFTAPEFYVIMACLISGYILTFFTFLILPKIYCSLNWYIDNEKPISAWLGHSGLNVILIIVVMVLWKGLWGLLKNYLITTFSIAITAHILGFALLLIHQVGSILGKSGIILDGNPVWFKIPPIKYFSTFHIFQITIEDNLEERLIVESYQSNESLEIVN